MKTWRRWIPVAGLTLLALALRLAYVWQIRGSSLVIPEELDPGFYYNWAKEIAGGAWLGKDPFVQSPLYAYLLGLFMKLAGDGITPILVAQSLVGCGTVLLTYVAGRRLLDERHGLLAGLLVALYGPFIFYEGMVMKTFLSPFFTILLVLLLDRARERAEAGDARASGRWPRIGAGGLFALGGVAYGLTVLDRDNFILLAPALALLALFLGGGATRRGLKAAGAFTLGTVLIIAPVTLRNWVAAHEFVLLTTGGGEVFFIGNNADANGLYVPPPFVRPDPRYEHADFIDRATEIAGHPLTPMQSSWFWFRQGLSFIRDDPGAWARLLARKMVHFWNFYELPDNLDYSVAQEFSPLLNRLNFVFPPVSWPTLSVPAAGVWMPVRLHLLLNFGTLAPLGLLGLVLTRRRWRRLLPVIVLLFGYMGTVLMFFNFSRFRVPVVPLLALPASASLMAGLRGLGRAGDLLLAFVKRSGEIAARTRALRPSRPALLALALLAILTVGVNIELPRGVVPAIEQALILGNAYYAQNDPDKALERYQLGLLLLNEGPPGPEGDRLLTRLGPAVTREALARELEIESVARGPQFKGIHLGIHHGLGLARLLKAQAILESGGNRRSAMALLDQAIADFNEALKISPSYLLSMRKLARATMLKGDNAGAVEILTKAGDLWPEDIRTRLELAEALFNSGEYKKALKTLDEIRLSRVALSNLDRAQLFVNRALIFSRGLNEQGRALYCFEKALEIEPAYPEAAQVRQAILSLSGSGFQPLSDDLYDEPAATKPNGSPGSPGPRAGAPPPAPGGAPRKPASGS